MGDLFILQYTFLMRTQSPSKILTQEFFARPALQVARDLLGKELVCMTRKGESVSIITEVEAYIGAQDKACHAHKGCTERTKVMFGPPGQWYVYLIYGMYWMLNIVTGKEGQPSAVLIRGVGIFNGPGKLTHALGIDKRFNGQCAVRKTGLWIQDNGIAMPASAVQRTPRIGVAYAQEWADKPYRFVLDTSRFAGLSTISN